MIFLHDESIDYFIAIIIISITLLIMRFFLRNKRKEIQLGIMFLTFTVFFYSGIGIAFNEVKDIYILHYTIFLIFLLLPFNIFKYKDRTPQFENYIRANSSVIDFFSFVYLFCLLLPCLYPTFKLGNILNFFSPGNLLNIFDTYETTRGDIVYKLCNNLSMIAAPAFFIKISNLVEMEQRARAMLYLIIVVAFEFCINSYMGRSTMLVYFVYMIFILYPPIIANKFNKKTFNIILICLLASVPALYAFIFFRQGRIVEDLSFFDALNALFLSEAYYPVFYDHILNSNIDTSLFTMFLWIVCLPIPSLVWGSKPAIDIYGFTESITGLTPGNPDFYVLLPSTLGEALSIGGPYLFYVYAFMVGCVYALMYRFLCRYKSLRYFLLYFIAFSLFLGRGGAASVLPNLINSTISLLIIYLIYCNSHNKKHKFY